MFIKTETESQLDAEIVAILTKMRELDKESEDYAKLLERVSKLHKLKSEEATILLRSAETESKMKPDRRIKPPSADTMLLVAANIFAILWLARYEKENVIKAPNAMRQVIKAR